MAVNWKKAEEYLKNRQGRKVAVKYAHNVYNETTHAATHEIRNQVTVLDAKRTKDLCYMIPCPKSPHGCDVDPSGEYIVGSGKLAALIPFSFDKLQKRLPIKTLMVNTMASTW